VYVEKPLTLFVKEGRWMVDVARRYKRVVQVGTQNRSGPNFQCARQFIEQGKLGKVVSVQSNFFRNVSPGFGNPSDQDPPQELNWDMMLGPAPARRYNPNRGIYHFRWFWDYSGGQMTNLGQHSLDLVHWITGVRGPKSVYSTGGRFFLKDNCEVPDTQDAIIEYPGFTAVCQYRECTAGRSGQGMGGLLFHGTYGTMSMSRVGYEVSADPKVSPLNIVAKVLPEATRWAALNPALNPRSRNSGPRARRTTRATPFWITSGTRAISWIASRPAKLQPVISRAAIRLPHVSPRQHFAEDRAQAGLGRGKGAGCGRLRGE